ncbi:MAG: NAD-dependent deacylase [Desulfosarcinaceae bacterium]|jgi:NAD-dependent deacetylase
MQTSIDAAARVLDEANMTVALTGAGISVESGIPPFRGKGGLWEKFDPMIFAHIDAFRRDPDTVWNLLLKSLGETLARARPNKAHRGLAELERRGCLQAVITQNVDGLHQMAGSREVIEFHGSMARHRCLSCDQGVPADAIDLTRLPPRCACGGVLRPDIVFFGEVIPFDALQNSERFARMCDAMLVVGTSATVEPAAGIPRIAKRHGACVIEINPEPTPLTRTISDISLMGPAGAMVSELVAALEALL